MTIAQKSCIEMARGCCGRNSHKYLNASNGVGCQVSLENRTDLRPSLRHCCLIIACRPKEIRHGDHFGFRKPPSCGSRTLSRATGSWGRGLSDNSSLSCSKFDLFAEGSRCPAADLPAFCVPPARYL